MKRSGVKNRVRLSAISLKVISFKKNKICGQF